MQRCKHLPRKKVECQSQGKRYFKRLLVNKANIEKNVENVGAFNDFPVILILTRLYVLQKSFTFVILVQNICEVEFVNRSVFLPGARTFKFHDWIYSFTSCMQGKIFSSATKSEGHSHMSVDITEMPVNRSPFSRRSYTQWPLFVLWIWIFQMNCKFSRAWRAF